MIKNLKNSKKKGFTLVELIAVIAIIGILAAVLVPTINGYITKSKKTKVVEQARQFVMAVESVAAEGKITTGKDSLKPDGLTGDALLAFNELCGIDASNTVSKVFDKLINGDKTITYSDAVKITSGDSFEIDKDSGKFNGMTT